MTTQKLTYFEYEAFLIECGVDEGEAYKISQGLKKRGLWGKHYDN